MRVGTILVLLMTPAAAAAQTAPQPSAQGDVSVTIYNNNQALVQDTRNLALIKGPNRIEFPDVANNIRPETVRLSLADSTIIEQNFDFDLLSPAALLQKAVGQTITIIRTNPATGVETRERAKVLANNGGVVLQIGTNIEVLRDDGLPVRVVYDSIPPNLRARPTLSVSVDSGAAGKRAGTLSYLTTGLGWNADYVALFDETKGVIDVQGWVTLRNTNNVAFDNAETVLVAGAPGEGRNGSAGLAPGSLAGTETSKRQRLGDFYLYPIDRRLTIAPNQQKQVSFLSVGNVPAKKIYRYRNDWLQESKDSISATSVLSFSSSKAGGLGDALPAGAVRVYIRDSKGQPQFIGENQIDHTPMGSMLDIPTGSAFDIKVKPELVKREPISGELWRRSIEYRVSFTSDKPGEVAVSKSVTYESRTFWRTSMKYTLTNARPNPVTVELIQGGLAQDWWWWGDWDVRVPNESIKGEQRSRDERVWKVDVPANGTVVVTADFDTRW
ncbi:DUF4139 domain-containing protein [Sphingomonas panacisoli]|uniref:DUF4139 domain-containing protein n=1 Tax=Sphingomonas panacisoli TaxID=1813879 RepID=A0A5B8LKM0_9SPHN|nr:DUF4139 domain-containing protein [Sphingomonas panacisoli]QDZ07640.1 DUF4139 domain-containing protein [Sphingomonas panacisoli]